MKVTDRQLGELTKPVAAPPIREWNKWWVLMWIAISLVLIGLVPFMYVWDWWLAVLIGFGVPEFIGSRVQDDSLPPLTHVIVKFVNPEISVPFMVGMAGGMWAHWLDAGQPFYRGVGFGLSAWFLVHFLLRYIPHRAPGSKE